MIKPFRRFFSANGVVDTLPEDREYDDGFIETMRCESGHLPLWPLHYARLLRSGVVRANFAAIEHSVADAVGCSAAAGTVKLRLRCGYRQGKVSWDISAETLVQNWSLEDGIELFPCRTRLQENLELNLGCKRLLRTAYDRASTELPVTTSAIEGLILDNRNNVIETLCCNLLFWDHSHCYTPNLSRCGVKGVMRSWLSKKVAIEQVDCGLVDLQNATEVALCNSLRGVIPVHSIWGLWHCSPGAGTRRLQQLIAEELW